MAELEESVELVGQAMKLAYESRCSLEVPKRKQGASGWSRELQEQRAEVRRAFNRANFTKNEQNRKAHADFRRCYKCSVVAAQKKGRENFCERIQSYPEIARFNRIVEGKPGG